MSKITVKLPDGREVEGGSVTEAIDVGLGSVTVSTPQSRAALKEKLKKAVEDELRKDGVTAESLGKVVENIIIAEIKPKTAEETARFKKDVQEMASVLVLLKANAGVDKAIETFNTSTDRAGKSHFPTGAAVGGGLGLGAALITDIGDWTSFTGILKKLTLIIAALAAGSFIGGASTNLFTPGKPKAEEKGAVK